MDHHNHHHHHHHHDHVTTATTSAPDAGAHQHHHHNHHDDHNHPAYFNFDYGATVLFAEWILNSRTGIYLLCIGTLVLGIIYQGIKHLRVYIHRDIPLVKHSAFTREHALQTLLYGLQIVVSYILMLIIMTFNVWIFICTVLGLGIGFFICEWHRPRTAGQCQRECAKPISRVNTGLTRLSVNDLKNCTDQELQILGENQCENCQETRM